MSKIFPHELLSRIQTIPYPQAQNSITQETICLANFLSIGLYCNSGLTSPDVMPACSLYFKHDITFDFLDGP